jgi:hypothetical protein
MYIRIMNSNATDKTNSTTPSEDYEEEDEKEHESIVLTKPKEAGKSLKEKVKSVGKKTEEKTKELKDKSMQTTRIGPTKDAHDIQALGTKQLIKLTAEFENTMSEIENESD